MRKSLSYALTLLVSAGLAGPTYADKLTVISAPEATKEAFQVNKRISWQNDLEAAKKQAATDKKLIFWVHMLGSMDGKT